MLTFFSEHSMNGFPDKILFFIDLQITELKIGDSGIIKQVSDESSEPLIYLSKAGLKLNDEIKVIEKINFDNSIQIHFRSGNIFLIDKLASNIYVIKK